MKTIEEIVVLIKAKIELAKIGECNDAEFMWDEIIKDYVEQERDKAFNKGFDIGFTAYQSDSTLYYPRYKNQNPLK